jgi:L-amino acid N-acyltransferase YncA
MTEVSLRRATPDDARRIWEWRNEPTARQASRQPEAISWEDHAAWFVSALAARIMLIGEHEGRAIGMVRLDPFDGGWRTSINLAPEARGQGLGRPLLAAALTHAPGPFVAEIRHGNAASERIFQDCGFAKTGDEGEFGQYRRD